MHIITIIIWIAVIGLLLWLINTYLPMPEPIKKILNVAAAVGLIVWLLYRLHAWGYI